MMTARQSPESMSLSQLLQGIAEVPALQDVQVRGLTLDSRRVTAGTLFCALAGSRARGHDYIQDAVARGAVAILAEAGESPAAGQAGIGVPLIAVPHLREKLGIIAARFYAEPSQQMQVIGITGTNGKTSVSRYLAQALSMDGLSGVIGTLGNGVLGAETAASHTTPDAITVQGLLAQQWQQGVRHVAMEVSSHGLDQARVNGVAFDTAVFTNLSRDHLDYHGGMDHYAAAKARLFTWPGLKHAVLNLDDPFGAKLLEQLPDTSRAVAYGLQPHEVAADVQWLWARHIATSLDGVEVEVESSWGRGRFHTALLGRFNVSNALAVLATLLVLGVEFEQALARMALLRPVAGRMERFGGDGLPLVVVDYAHTPDALEQVLRALREHSRGRLWCVFGCGGDRDAGKRPQMGAIAQQYADQVVITNDNPRSEPPEVIAEAILDGMENRDEAMVQLDRAAAIDRAIAQAAAGDVVLVAGKGHEDYQIIGGQRLHFDDREHVQASLAKRRELGAG
jgi:UDP-N-acetylmuramoyl-L-alanyl-D-glutamate--2,6-diaminopimelate ligase